MSATAEEVEGTCAWRSSTRWPPTRRPQRVRPCVDIDSWVDAIVAGRPYARLVDAARARRRAGPDAGRRPRSRQALADHPRIGERHAGQRRQRRDVAGRAGRRRPARRRGAASAGRGQRGVRGALRPDLPGPRRRPQRRGDPGAARAAADQRPRHRARGHRRAAARDRRCSAWKDSSHEHALHPRPRRRARRARRRPRRRAHRPRGGGARGARDRRRRPGPLRPRPRPRRLRPRTSTPAPWFAAAGRDTFFPGGLARLRRRRRASTTTWRCC